MRKGISFLFDCQKTLTPSTFSCSNFFIWWTTIGIMNSPTGCFILGFSELYIIIFDFCLNETSGVSALVRISDGIEPCNSKENISGTVECEYSIGTDILLTQLVELNRK